MSFKFIYDTIISEIEKKLTDHNHDKYIAAPKLNKFTANARLTKANLITTTDFDNKLMSFNKKQLSNKTRHMLVKNELKKLQTFNSIYFGVKSHFEEDGAQNYLVFQVMYISFSGVDSGNYIYIWKCKGLSDERINFIATSNYTITSKLSYYGTKTKVEFNGSCLKEHKTTYNQRTIVNIYIVCELSRILI